MWRHLKQAAPSRARAESTVIRVVLVAALCAGALPAVGGEVFLKNGLVIEGATRRLQTLTSDRIRQRENDVPYFPYLLIENGYQRIFIPKAQGVKIDDRDELSKYETFTIVQHKNGVKQTMGRLVATTPFNEFGRRTHTVETEKGAHEIVVGATKITPKVVSVTGINYQWDYGVATQSVPPAQLDAMIRHISDPKNPDHRFAIARFYLQAGLYEESGKELEGIAKEFPELARRVDDARKELQNFEHKLIVQELARRKAAGQHELAHSYALAVPKDASATVRHDVQELIRDYNTSRERIAKMHSLLGQLEARIDDARLAASCAPLRSAVERQLTIESLGGLQAFFNLVDDTTLKPQEKLALAYSGWVVGSASAVTDLRLAVRLWTAQHAILEYLHAETPQERNEQLRQIEALDGVTPDLVVKLLRNLPPVFDTPDLRPGEPGMVRVAGRDSETLPSYGVLLPLEYDPRHAYPMIVALRPPEHSIRTLLEFWGGTLARPGMALRRGYIVIAPDYIDDKAREYSYSVQAHDVVLRAIIDARKRFNVDSDRIFLTGHGIGGTAAFDMGMSHPDLFAGVVPFNGISDQYCKWYAEKNAAHTSWYVVVGEFDPTTFTADAPTLGRMMQKGGADVLVAEFVQRGSEPYFEEVPRIFDWMALLRRHKPPRDFSMSVLRPSENRFYWIQADGFPKSVLQSTVLAGPSRGEIHPVLLGGKITPGNTILLSSGAKSHTLWLSADLVNLQKKVTVTLRGMRKFHGTARPSIAAELEDFRLRGDRQLIYNVRLELD